MEQLVCDCIQFIAENMMSIIDMRVDLSNNSDEIMGRLAKVDETDTQCL